MFQKQKSTFYKKNSVQNIIKLTNLESSQLQDRYTEKGPLGHKDKP